MTRPDTRRAAFALLLAPLFAACVAAEIDGSIQSRPAEPAAGGAGTSGRGPAGSGGSTGSAPMAGAGGMIPTIPIPTEASLLPARVRRLSNYEYDRTVAALLQTTTAPGEGFAVDFRQNDFTQNAAQQVDAILAGQLQAAARELAKASVPKVIAGAGCAATAGDSCATQIINTFGAQAYRRPITDLERTGLLSVFRAGATGATFNDGVENLLIALLQSPNFLFVTELGDAPAKDGVIRLSNHEIASALSYMLTGGPPDKPLVDAAVAGKLVTPAERTLQTRRLLMRPEARPQIARLFKEWLGIDHLANTGKDANVYPKYAALKPAMLAEADAFLSEAIFTDDGTLTKILTADYTVVDQALAQVYGLSSMGPTKRTPYGTSARRGILMQAAFQSVHANDHETHPVKRGNTLLKKVLCVTLPLPGELNIDVVPPLPDAKKTTRERFIQHSSDPACAGCHRMIDPLGFIYENIDGMGALRTTEAGKPVVTEGDVLAGDITGIVKDGVDLAGRLAASAQVKECFARNLFRFSAAQSGQGYEELFLRDVWGKLPAAQQVNVKEVLVALAASDAFISRRIP